MTTFKEKESGKIYTFIGSTSGSEGTFFTLATDPEDTTQSPIIRVPIEEIITRFDTVSDKIDYSAIWPQVMNYMHLNPELNDLFNAFLRRTTPDYYLPGKYVYILHPQVFGIDVYSIEDYIYQVKRIDNLFTGEQNLILGKTLSTSDAEVSFKMKRDRLERGDAFYCVKRLDMPF